MTPGEPVEIDGDGPHVVGIDTGIKLSIIRQLKERGCRITLLPCDTSAEEVLARDPDLVFLANGPGDPGALDYVVENVRGVVGKKPVVGICLGHQLLCRAVGLETFKLPFGHRGANHPVKDLETGRIDITSQNHGFAVLGPGGDRTIEGDEPVRWQTDFGEAELSHLNLYDRTVEGLVLKDVPGCTVQYHPEAGPGPARRPLPLRPLPGAGGMSDFAPEHRDHRSKLGCSPERGDREQVRAMAAEIRSPRNASGPLCSAASTAGPTTGRTGMAEFFEEWLDSFVPALRGSTSSRSSTTGSAAWRSCRLKSRGRVRAASA